MKCCTKQRRKARRARKRRRPEKKEKRIRKRTPESCSKMPSSKARGNARKFCAMLSGVDWDPWGTSYRLVIWNFQTIQGSGAPTDVPTVLKIVEALFPKGAPREGYPSDVTLDVPLFQISELKLAAKRLRSENAPGPGSIPNEVFKATIHEKSQLILDLFNTCLERGHFLKQSRNTRQK